MRSASSGGTRVAAVMAADSRRELHRDSGELTCGGGVHPPTAGEPCAPSSWSRATPRARCDTTNANAALIARTVVQRIGNIDPALILQRIPPARRWAV